MKQTKQREPSCVKRDRKLTNRNILVSNSVLAVQLAVIKGSLLTLLPRDLGLKQPFY